ncbi:hypothetical protein ABPG72_012114 [Tetrahymena utriculariae]
MSQQQLENQQQPNQQLEWKDIEGFYNYEVSNLGQIRNKKSGRILKVEVIDNKYHRVSLSQNGIQTDYILSKVPDYFQLIKKGELKQAYQKLFKIYQQLEQSKNKDLKISEEQYDEMYNKFEELSSGYNKLRKNIKACNEEYKIQQQARYQNKLQKKNERISNFKKQRENKAIKEHEEVLLKGIFDEEIKPLAAGKKKLKEVKNMKNNRNTYKHEMKKVNGLEENAFRLEFDEEEKFIVKIINNNHQKISI